MKLLVDRQAMIDRAWAGFGDVAYDLLAPNTQYYAADVKRDRDLDQAKSLLQKAGMARATITLPTCNFLPGMVESSTILAQQAAEAGLKINVDTRSAATYFTPAGGFLTRPFGYEVDQPVGSLLVAYRSEYTPDAPYPDTHWGSQPGGAAAQRLISKAIGATNPTQAASLWRQCQLQQFHEGLGNLVRGAANRGLKRAVRYSNWRLQDGWLADLGTAGTVRGPGGRLGGYRWRCSGPGVSYGKLAPAATAGCAWTRPGRCDRHGGRGATQKRSWS
jgi:hypothetical protein